jgi:hypothetical protein
MIYDEADCTKAAVEVSKLATVIYTRTKELKQLTK